MQFFRSSLLYIHGRRIFNLHKLNHSVCLMDLRDDVVSFMVTSLVRLLLRLQEFCCPGWKQVGSEFFHKTAHYLELPPSQKQK